MIDVHITQNSLTVKGHAGYAETGHDIYCSAVSSLTQGLMHSLDALTEDVISGEAEDSGAEEIEDIKARKKAEARAIKIEPRTTCFEVGVDKDIIDTMIALVHSYIATKKFNPRSREGNDGICDLLVRPVVQISIHVPTRGTTMQRQTPGIQ